MVGKCQCHKWCGIAEDWPLSSTWHHWLIPLGFPFWQLLFSQGGSEPQREEILATCLTSSVKCLSSPGPFPTYFIQYVWFAWNVKTFWPGFTLQWPNFPHVYFCEHPESVWWPNLLSNSRVQLLHLKFTLILFLWPEFALHWAYFIQFFREY